MAGQWSELELEAWEPTYLTLHRWIQIVGKVTLAFSSPANHWWNTTLRFEAHGLATRLLPVGDRQLQIAFDFVEHVLHLSTSDGQSQSMALHPQSVAAFYRRFLESLAVLDVHPHIWPVPVEVSDTTPFPEDTKHASYDHTQVETMWSILTRVEDVFTRFAGRYTGKCSPVHLFWGAFDVAVTRFSGHRNPNPPSDKVMGPAYSHEVLSHGFWFGGDWPTGPRVPEAVFYAYAVPAPPGFASASVAPAAAQYEQGLGEFVLPYAAVRNSATPDADVLAFMQSTYDAGANLAGWDREALEAR